MRPPSACAAAAKVCCGTRAAFAGTPSPLATLYATTTGAGSANGTAAAQTVTDASAIAELASNFPRMATEHRLTAPQAPMRSSTPNSPVGLPLVRLRLVEVVYERFAQITAIEVVKPGSGRVEASASIASVWVLDKVRHGVTVTLC